MIGLFLAIVIPLFIFFRTWLKGIQCPIVKDMRGRIVLISGSNRGIGRETALALAKMGA